MTCWTEMHMRRSREGVCENNAVQFQSCDSSSYCTALGYCHLPAARFQYGQTSGAGNSLKAKPIRITKTIVVNHPWWCQNWWKVCDKQICRTGASQFWNSVVSSPRCLAHCCTKSSPGGRKTFLQWRWGTDSSDFIVPDVDGRLLWHRHTNVGAPVW